ncbi:MAG TPA: plastocyanin/azurin family copper-binding protein [Candidatus Thermoplasmatota archaeon]|nr:plastocyanin/azurin family copper-binding protein [Candidatus Thermoplasmatota archaeon]
MKTIGFTMIALGLAVAAVPAVAQGQTSFTLDTHTDGGGGYFTLEGESQRNPTLNVAPGEQITVTIRGTDDGVHNFCYPDTRSCSEYVQAEGETQTFTFTAPASGSGEYFCLPHRGAGMKGTLSAGGSTTNGGGSDGGNDTPGFAALGALVALAGLALVLRRK